MAKRSTKGIAVGGPDIQHLKWLVDSRARNQHSAVALFALFQKHKQKLRSKDLSAKSQRLVAVCFSLWRAAFLADRTGVRDTVFEHANAFLEKMITDNSIAFLQDRNSREWTFKYYMDSATATLSRLAEDWADIEPMLTPKAISSAGHTGPQRRWNRCQDALDAAIKHLERELLPRSS